MIQAGFIMKRETLMRASIRSSVVAVPLLAALVTTVWADTPLVVKGRPQAVIVTSREPVPVASYAATELQYHVAKATGVELPIVTEDATPESPAGRVYVGDCEAAKKVGIRADGLDPEAFVMRTKGNALYLAGHDSEGSPLTDSTRAGTLFAVYEFLEQTLYFLYSSESFWLTSQNLWNLITRRLI